MVTNEGSLKVGTGHYNLSNSSPTVKAAGTIKLVKGKIMEITNNSGHYRPTADEMAQSIKEMQSKGINLSGATVKIYGADGTLQKTYKIK